jgi:hypothetical protein
MPKIERHSAREMLIALERWGFERVPGLAPILPPHREQAAKEAGDAEEAAGFSNQRRRRPVAPAPAPPVASAPPPAAATPAARAPVGTGLAKVDERPEDDAGPPSLRTQGDEPKGDDPKPRKSR